MASDAGEYESEYESDSAAVDEALLTERLDDEARAPPSHDSNDTEPLGNGDHSGGNADAIGGSVVQQQQASDCWRTARSVDTDVAQTTSDCVVPRPTQPQRRRKLDKEQQQIQSLTRQLSQSKKLVAELRQQLQVFYKNEAVAQLENRNREKQLQIDELLHENRMLQHQHRLLAKQIEELQGAKDHFPKTKHALLEDLRVTKERLRQCRDTQRDTDDRASKAHQHAVDLATKNKTLVERIKTLEAAASTANASLLAPSSSSPPLLDAESVIASQEDEITRLQQRVALMKASQRSERVKQERRLSASHDEVEHTRAQLDTFQAQLVDKEKAIRGLYLQMKKLRRAVLELTNAQQTNEHMRQMACGRDVRMLGHGAHHHQQHQHHRASQSQLFVRNANGAPHAALAQSLPLAITKKVPSHRIQDTLRQLGYIPSFPSSSSASPARQSSNAWRSPFGPYSSGDRTVVGDDADEDDETLPPNCVQGRLIPGPPPPSAERRAIASGVRTPRSQLYAAVTVPSLPSPSAQQDCEHSGERVCANNDASDDVAVHAIDENDIDDFQGADVSDDIDASACDSESAFH